MILRSFHRRFVFFLLVFSAGEAVAQGMPSSGDTLLFEGEKHFKHVRQQESSPLVQMFDHLIRRRFS
jgi:hypothetical protein